MVRMTSHSFFECSEYRGEPPTHPMLWRWSIGCHGESRFRGVEISLEIRKSSAANSALLKLPEKKAVMAAWLEDPRPRVKGFAAGYIGGLDQRIASNEDARAKQMKEQRKRDFELDNDD